VPTAGGHLGWGPAKGPKFPHVGRILATNPNMLWFDGVSVRLLRLRVRRCEVQESPTPGLFAPEWGHDPVRGTMTVTCGAEVESTVVVCEAVTT